MTLTEKIAIVLLSEIKIFIDIFLETTQFHSTFKVKLRPILNPRSVDSKLKPSLGIDTNKMTSVVFFFTFLKKIKNKIQY
jgi:hypothetical protein